MWKKINIEYVLCWPPVGQHKKKMWYGLKPQSVYLRNASYQTFGLKAAAVNDKQIVSGILICEIQGLS